VILTVDPWTGQRVIVIHNEHHVLPSSPFHAGTAMTVQDYLAQRIKQMNRNTPAPLEPGKVEVQNG
jgi:hypothetical protein